MNMEDTVKTTRDTAEGDVQIRTDSEYRDALELLIENIRPDIWSDLRCALAAMEVIPWHEHRALLQAILKRKDRPTDLMREF